jgi:hypothetical protein
MKQEDLEEINGFMEKGTTDIIGLNRIPVYLI